MNLSRIEIENFRNFEHLDVAVGDSLVIVGENQIGKSNLLFALRLLLDPSLPESARQLSITDFWDGLERPLPKDAAIRISVELVEFDDDEDILALLADHLISGDPMVARLTYEFRPRPDLAEPPVKDGDFEYSVYGGNSGRTLNYEIRRRLPLEALHALRDVESDLARWTKSPLRPLLARAQALIDSKTLDEIVEDIEGAAKTLTELDAIEDVSDEINARLYDMVGKSQALETTFGLATSDSQKLLRSLRLRIDEGERDISESSLGAANVLYLALRAIELQKQAKEGTRSHTFFAIEEPEAHLHPQLQRKVYRSFLKGRDLSASENDPVNSTENLTYVLTTHSPHIASVAPVNSFAILRPSSDRRSTVGTSSAGLSLDERDTADLERYLDVNRAEILFGRGVLLVEGDAERFLLPVMANRLGYDLDALGLTICSVSGTNFAPYVSFLGSKGLDFPLAVLTDLDPNSNGTRGESRVLKSIVPAMVDDDIEDLESAEELGIYVNAHTLEVDLIRAGFWVSFDKCAKDLTKSQAVRNRFAEIRETKSLEDTTRFLKDIDAIGKGRFAQRLAAYLAASPRKAYPAYIKKAFEHVISQIQ